MRPKFEVKNLGGLTNMLSFEQYYFGVQQYRPTIEAFGTTGRKHWRRNVKSAGSHMNKLNWVASLLGGMVEQGWATSARGAARIVNQELELKLWPGRDIPGKGFADFFT
jgi:hypothetical protein